MSDWFPIMQHTNPTAKWWIPWSVIAPHEAQARTNHSQSLERLAERGGLAPCEALAILEDRRWKKMDNHNETTLELAKLVFQRLKMLERGNG